MSHTFPKGYVSSADQTEIILSDVPTEATEEIRSLGFSALDGRARLEVGFDNAAKAKIFAILRDHGIPFSGGKEWNPSELFHYYREQSLLAGPYIDVSWTGPDKPTFRLMLNVGSLKAILDDRSIRRDVYSINAEENEAYVIIFDGNAWRVYYSERGRHNAERIFIHETEAAQHFLKMVLTDQSEFWKTIPSFKSSGELNRFTKALNDAIAMGEAVESNDKTEKTGLPGMFEYRKITNVETGEKWILAFPDGPFSGSWYCIKAQ